MNTVHNFYFVVHNNKRGEKSHEPRNCLLFLCMTGLAVVEGWYFIFLLVKSGFQTWVNLKLGHYVLPIMPVKQK